MQRHHRIRRGEVQLGQQDPIGRLDLGARLLVTGELTAARLGVDDTHHAGRDRRRPLPAERFEPVEDRPWLGDAGGLEQDDLRLRSAVDLVDGGPQLRLHPHLVTDAAAGQLHDVAGPALDQARVDVDAPELVDDHADAPLVLPPEHAVDRRRLARAEKPGQQDERRFGESEDADGLQRAEHVHVHERQRARRRSG